ncbi:thioredoxin reductase 1, cytoplasmic-like isoform X2 [Candoia aspera]|uniref:thioredoxin reductase 1, cytoplasmic-like isoform X2 n=1 Tax=Candoia aspera TaxID=51853 RepID=UPI002FD7CE51
MGNSARKGRVAQQAPAARAGAQPEQRASATPLEVICRCCRETLCIESIQPFHHGAKQREYTSINEESTTVDATQKAFQIHGKGKNVEAAINSKDWKLAVQTLIDENSVMIFSNTTCKFCAKVKDLFRSMDVPYFALELDQTDASSLLQPGAL